MCVSVFEKQIDVCFFMRKLFPLNNKPALTRSLMASAEVTGGGDQSSPRAPHGVVWCVTWDGLVAAGNGWSGNRGAERQAQTHCPSVGFNKELCLLQRPGMTSSQQECASGFSYRSRKHLTVQPINCRSPLFCSEGSESDSRGGKITRWKSSVKQSKQKPASAGWFTPRPAPFRLA